MDYTLLCTTLMIFMLQVYAAPQAEEDKLRRQEALKKALEESICMKGSEGLGTFSGYISSKSLLCSGGIFRIKFVDICTVHIVR